MHNAHDTQIDTEAMRLYQSGLSMVRVAQQLGLTEGVVRYRLKRAGCQLRSIKETKLAGVDAAEVVRLYNSGMSMSGIARHLHTSSAKVQFRLDHAGISRRTMSEVKRGTKLPQMLRRVAWTCPQCGKTIELERAVARERKYCSRKCASKATPNPLFHAKPRPQKVCPTCQTTFAVQTLYKAPHRKYCSHACAMYDLHQQRRSGQARVMERIVEALLLGMGITYIPQWRIGTLSADFYLPESRLPIECDGTWWHALPTKVREDLRKERAYANAGLPVLHITEDEVFADISAVKQKIQDAVAKVESRKS